MSSSSRSSQVEEVRIHEVYAKRQGDVRYSWFSPGHLFIIQERERQLLGLLKKKGIAPLEGKVMLEVGCGTGYWLRQFINWGIRPSNLNGIDLLPDRVDEARRLCPEAVRIECRSATELEYADDTFDLVLQSTVFSSVLDHNMRQQIALEMQRVVKADGAIIWYDFHVNNPLNPNVLGVKKQDIIQLFPDCHIDISRVTLAPPLVRKLASFSWLLCSVLERIKVANTHYLGTIQKL